MPAARGRSILRFLELVLLYWVSAIGRWVVKLATGGRVALPRTGLVTDDTMPHGPGLRANLHGLARWFAYDTVYFAVGIVVLVVVFMAVLLLYAHLFGPIAPLHEWMR